jgi:CO/xanthine dehydrogenase FAD-binding subunit
MGESPLEENLRRLTDEVIAEAQRVLSSELNLTSDFRGSGAYRTELAQVFLKRLLQRCSGRIGGRS